MDVPSIDQKLSELARKLSASLPDGASYLRRDIEQNFKAVLQSALSKMELVSRREFDIQAGVLQRTREKLAALEQRLQQLESPKY
ncbi:MAG: accessory factor UbiK family protein [Steroidobacteraceae bacterium]